MAVPTNEQIQAFLSNFNGQDTVLLRSRTVPPYPEPNVGDRYLLTAGRDKDCIFECVVPRRWTGALKINPRTGMQVLDKSTGEFWMYNGTQWTSALPYYAQMGVLMTEGGGGAVTIYPTTADLRVIPTIGAGIEAGITVSIGGFPWATPGGTFEIPLLFQWAPNFPIGLFPALSPTAYEPWYVIPDDVWALLPNPVVTGAWINPAASNSNQGADITDINHPMPLNNPPENPEQDQSFLTGPGYFEPGNALTVATFTDGDWVYDHPSSTTYFRYGNRQQVFFWRLGESPSGWSFQIIDPSTDLPLFPIVNGFANCPDELTIVTPNLDDVYLVGNAATFEWSGHEGQFVWLAPNETDWMFGTMAPYQVVNDSPHVSESSMVLVRELGYRAYWMMATGAGWKKLTADCEVTTNSPAVGISPTVILSGNIKPNWLNKRQQNGRVVFEFVPQSNPWWGSSVITTGMAINGTRGYTEDNGDFAITFNNGMGGGTGTKEGVLIVDGRVYSVTMTINP